MLRRISIILPFFACFALIGVLPCGAAARPGPPRALRLSFEGETLPASPVIVGQVAPFMVGNGYNVLFSRESDGTRNLYRATPLRDTSGKILSWRATPLTRLSAPNFVASPAPLPDGSSALCIVGSTSDAATSGPVTDDDPTDASGTVSRVDFVTGQLKSLVPDNHCFDPAPAPDGLRFAWSAERSGIESVWIASYGGERHRIAMRAQHPVWLDANTLIYESLRDGRRGIYRVPVNAEGQPQDEERRQLWPRGGEVAVSPDRDTLCVASSNAAGNDLGSTSLYLLAADGSGGRAIAGTEGARHPRWLPDGSGVLYDAPLPDDRVPSTPATARNPVPRAMWLLPMRSVAPVALLLEARPSRTDARVVEIYGTAWCEGDDAPQLRLEVGSGDAPERWQEIAAAKPPIQQSVLGRWTPPANAEGTWTLRLTVTSTAGEETQNTLPVLLPLVAPLSPAPGGDFAGAITIAPQPPSSLPPVAPHPTPTSRPIATPGATPAPTQAPVVAAPPTPSGNIPPTLPPTPRPTSHPTSRPRPPRRSGQGSGGSRPNPAAAFGDAARIDVSGTPAEMGVGETLEVIATMRNLGRSAWTGSGANPVRLLVRWTDRSAGYRVRWAVVWPQTTTRPGQKSQVRFAVTSPSRPGRYKVTYALLRVPGGVAKPPGGTGDDPWPGEFGSAAYAVNVK